MSQPEQREEAVFEAALQLPDDQRAAYLEKECAGDADLRRRVEVLLGAFERAGGFMKQPAVPVTGETVPFRPLPTAKLGDKIDRYKLLEQIGEGGCGVVYVAEQEEPVRRRVALKVIKLGMDTKQVIARFDAERQALAIMDHPNIAKVHDAGSTDTGRPYFVMELVRGIKITDYCDQNHLAPRERLDLFMQVCRAIQHAHQKGIIHRDIKPSNIIVTLHDGVPVPKVIDFGIAKATQGRLTDQTVYTAFEQFIGTPAYMSPEQATMSGLDIDTRSDIYSLGILLYELLTGTTPFDANELLAKGLDEMCRTIREVEPVKPSTRLTQELNSKSGTRSPKPGIESAIRNRQSPIPSDLDWIVMKCLEKDRARRYETANGLATDIQRHLSNEPIVARPPSKLYEFQKTFQRHKFGFLAVAAVVLALGLGVIVSTRQAIRATSAEKEQFRLRGHAQQSETLAKQQAALALTNAAEARRQERIALQNAETARREKQAAEAQELLGRRRFYAAVMNLAMNAWESGKVARVADLLETLRPEAGQPDLRRFEWFYLWRLSHPRLSRTLVAPGYEISSVVFSPDSKLIASAHTGENIIRLRSVQTGETVKSLPCKTGVTVVAYTQDGKNLVSGGRNGQAKLWDVASGELLHVFMHKGGVGALAVSHDGQLLATGASEEAVNFWDLKTRELLSSHPVSGYPVRMEFTPDDSSLYVGANWGGGSTPKFSVLIPQQGSRPKIVWITPIRSVAIAPDNRQFATVSWDVIDLWDAQTRRVARLSGHLPNVTSLCWSPDSQTLFSCGLDRTIRAWAISSNQTERIPSKLLGVHGASAACIAAAPNGRTVASGSVDGSVRVWDVAKTDEQAAELSATHFKVGDWLGARVISVLPTPDGGSAYVTTLEKGTRRYDLATGLPGIEFPEARGRGALSPDGRRLATGDRQGKVALWETSAGTALGSAILHKESERPLSLCFSPDGKKLYSGAVRGDLKVRVWEAEAELKPMTNFGLNSFAAGVNAVACSPDGQKIAAVFRHERIFLVDANSLKTLTRIFLTGGSAEIYALTFSPDGKTLASAGDSGVIDLHDVSTGQRREVLHGHATAIRAVAFSPDGETLASGGNDRTLRLWDLSSGQEKVSLTQPAVPTALSFTPDGGTLLVGDDTGGVSALRGSPLPQSEQLPSKPMGEVWHLNYEAWALATDADPERRDGVTAVKLAEQAVALVDRNNAPTLLDTLAAAYAETGQFEKAVAIQKEAISLLNAKEVPEDYLSRLKLYESGSPFHQPVEQ